MASTLVGKTTAVAPSELNTYYRNARRGDIPSIMSSLRRHGQYKPISVNVGTHTGRPNEVLAGNHTLMAFRELADAEPKDARWRKIKAYWIDVDDDMAERINVADNKIGSLGGYDNEILAEQLKGFGSDIEGLGYVESDIAALLNATADKNPPIVTDPDDLPPIPADPSMTRTAVGERWRLGPHRLLVGDATDVLAVTDWLAGDMPDCIWTDPPYGVSYVGKTADALTIQNDDGLDLPALISGAAETWRAVCRPGAPFYVASPAGPQFADFAAGLAAGGVDWRQTLVWVKNTMVLGRSDYHYRHEAIFYGFVPAPSGSGRLGRGGDAWHGENNATSTLFHDKPAASEEHPTMKPVSLISECLLNSCRPGGLVLDTFGGSGSTLIAAHVNDRRAALVELDPVYADVIISRYEKATGDEAVLEDDD